VAITIVAMVTAIKNIGSPHAWSYRRSCNRCLL